MRWSELFADLEAQLAQADHAALTAEVADRTRRERSAVSWSDRAAACVGASLAVSTPVGPVRGTLEDLGSDWLLLDEERRGSVVVPMSVVLAVSGLPARSDDHRGLGRRFGLGVALRAIARDRCAVAIEDRHTGVSTGTIDRVGADHLDLAEHPTDAIRRAAAITGRRVIPFAAIALVRRG